MKVQVRHERNKWSMVEVTIDKHENEGTEEQECRARDKLRRENYSTYLSVTEHPLLPERDENYEKNISSYREAKGLKTYKPSDAMWTRFK